MSQTRLQPTPPVPAVGGVVFEDLPRRLRENEPNEPELAVARKAREATKVGLEARELNPRPATRRAECD